MPNTKSWENVPDKWKQPSTEFDGRIVRNKKELVTYSSSSHIRIWYNNQAEGYEQHSHEALEVFICIQNKYQIRANNREYMLHEGDILMIPPNMLHEYINDKEGVRFIYLIEMNSFFASHDFKAIEPLFFDAFLCNSTTCPDIYAEIYQLFMDMNTVYFKKTNFWETIIYSKMYQIFIAIAQHYENTMKDNMKDETTNSSQSINRINALLRYVDVNYSEDISTEQAAEYTGFSKFHFMRLFKLQTGYTFHDYLTLKRIKMAEELLMTDTPITDIAFQTGFNTLPSFCRAFKKYTNYSPSEYKKLRLTSADTNHTNV